MKIYASGPSASAVGGSSASGDCSESNAKVLCTRFPDRARRSLSRSKLPRRARIQACHPIRRQAVGRHHKSGPRFRQTRESGTAMLRPGVRKWLVRESTWCRSRTHKEAWAARRPGPTTVLPPLQHGARVPRLALNHTIAWVGGGRPLNGALRKIPPLIR